MFTTFVQNDQRELLKQIRGFAFPSTSLMGSNGAFSISSCHPFAAPYKWIHSHSARLVPLGLNCCQKREGLTNLPPTAGSMPRISITARSPIAPSVPAPAAERGAVETYSTWMQTLCAIYIPLQHDGVNVWKPNVQVQVLMQIELDILIRCLKDLNRLRGIIESVFPTLSLVATVEHCIPHPVEGKESSSTLFIFIVVWIVCIHCMLVDFFVRRWNLKYIVSWIAHVMIIQGVQNY